MDISNFTIEKLKSLAYDALTELEFIQKNLNIINNEIAKKKEMEQAKSVPEKVKENKEKEVKPTKEK